jgi:AhpD family alkylhydroperoxidase
LDAFKTEELAMKKLQIFDPALCCSTGVCGVDVDQALVDFSADVDWAKQNGAQIERFNLAQQPMAFAENATVKNFLESSGQEGLPLVLLNGEVALSGRYPSRDELAKWLGITAVPSLFSAQVAELVAIGAAVGCNCEPCFKYHYDQARKLGVGDADMRRAVDLAQMVKDTPARAILNLAERYVGPSAPGAAVKQSPCCDSTSSVTEKLATKCC